MRLIRKMLLAEFKLVIKNLLKLLSGFLLFGLFIGAALFASESARTPIELTIGVVMPEEPATQLAFSFVTKSSGSLEHISFQEMSYPDGISSLKENQITALLIIPDGFAEEVMYGTIPELEVILSDSIGIESLLFQEMAESCIGILYDTQIGSNAAHQFVQKYGHEYAESDHGEEIAFSYLKFLFRRLNMFRESPLSSAAYDSSTLRLSCGITLLLLFSGISCSGLFLWEKRGFTLFWSHHNKGLFWISWVKMLGMFFALQIPFFLSAAVLLFISVPISSWLIIFTCMELVLFYVSLLTMIVYESAKDLLTGVLLLFGGGFLLVFLSGGFLPAAYLPKAFSALAPLLPTYGMIQTIAGALCGTVSYIGLSSLGLYGFLFLLLPIISRSIQQKGALR